MNFFGHVVVASWADEDAAHLLGSMLPDFEAMTGVPLVEVWDADIQRGIDLHHRTDDAFHRANAFVMLCARALEGLLEAGVRRGTARAVAHIGTEMFLDGWLTREQTHVDHYLAALRVEVTGRLEWEDAGRAFSRLQRRLETWGAPCDYEDPEFVSARLSDALRSRSTLAVLEDESMLVAHYLADLQQMVERKAPELLDEIWNALGFGH